MNILNIWNNKELSDIPILYILRIIDAIQKESINEKSSSSGSQLPKSKKIFKKHLETLQNITQPNII